MYRRSNKRRYYRPTRFERAKLRVENLPKKTLEQYEWETAAALCKKYVALRRQVIISTVRCVIAQGGFLRSKTEIGAQICAAEAERWKREIQLAREKKCEIMYDLRLLERRANSNLQPTPPTHTSGSDDVEEVPKPGEIMKIKYAKKDLEMAIQQSIISRIASNCTKDLFPLLGKPAKIRGVVLRNSMAHVELPNGTVRWLPFKALTRKERTESIESNKTINSSVNIGNGLSYKLKPTPPLLQKVRPLSPRDLALAEVSPLSTDLPSLTEGLGWSTSHPQQEPHYAQSISCHATTIPQDFCRDTKGLDFGKTLYPDVLHDIHETPANVKIKESHNPNSVTGSTESERFAFDSPPLVKSDSCMSVNTSYSTPRGIRHHASMIKTNSETQSRSSYPDTLSPRCITLASVPSCSISICLSEGESMIESPMFRTKRFPRRGKPPPGADDEFLCPSYLTLTTNSIGSSGGKLRSVVKMNSAISSFAASVKSSPNLSTKEVKYQHDRVQAAIGRELLMNTPTIPTVVLTPRSPSPFNCCLPPENLTKLPDVMRQRFIFGDQKYTKPVDQRKDFTDYAPPDYICSGKEVDVFCDANTNPFFFEAVVQGGFAIRSPGRFLTLITDIKDNYDEMMMRLKHMSYAQQVSMKLVVPKSPRNRNFPELTSPPSPVVMPPSSSKLHPRSPRDVVQSSNTRFLTHTESSARRYINTRAVIR